VLKVMTFCSNDNETFKGKITLCNVQNTKCRKTISNAREVIGDGEKDKNYNRIQTDRRGWGCGKW